MIFKKKHRTSVTNEKDTLNSHDELIDTTEVLELKDISEEKYDELEIEYEPEDDYIEINESVELEEINDDSEITLEEVTDSDDDDYLEKLDELQIEDVSDGAVIDFAKRWSLVLAMSAAALVIGVVSVVSVSKQTNTVAAVIDASTTQEPETERFLLLTDDYKNIEYKSVSLEVIPEDTSVTVNIVDSEQQPCTGVLFKAVAVKGVVDDNRDFLDDVVRNENVDDFDTSDEIPYIQSNDDDLDGTIVFDNLEEDTYTIALLSASGYNPAEPVEVSTVKFDIIDNIIEKVVAESSNTIKEDPESNRNNAASQPPATAAPITTAPSTEPPKKIEVDVAKEIDGELLYSSTFGETKMLSDEELKSYTSTVVNVSSGEGVSQLSGYILSTGEKNIGKETVKYISQILVADEINISSIGGFDFSIIQVFDRTTVDNISSTTSASKTTQAPSTTKANGNTQTTSQTTQGATDTTNSTTVKPTAKPSETQSSAAKPVPTQPATTQPATEAKKTYRVINLEPVVEKKQETVYADGWQTIEGNRYYYRDGKALTGWNLIDGIQYKFSESGVLSSKTMIDVSRFNGNIDWSSVKKSGIDYAIIRVGYRGYESGKLVMDSMFEKNMKEAIAAGINVGAYIVTQAVNTAEAVEEASFIVNACKKYNISLPLVIDVESAGGGSGRGDKISASTRTAVINAYAQTVRGAGYTPMLYASKSWLEGRINTGSVYSYCKIWIARYSDSLNYSGRYNMWQFRSDGAVNGINGCVDINAWIN